MTMIDSAHVVFMEGGGGLQRQTALLLSWKVVFAFSAVGYRLETDGPNVTTYTTGTML